MNQNWQRNQDQMRRQQEQMRKQQEQLRNQQMMGAWQQQEEEKKRKQRRVRQVQAARMHANPPPLYPAGESTVYRVQKSPSCLARLGRFFAFMLIFAVLAFAALICYATLIEGSLPF